MAELITVLIILASVLLILVVLMQNPKGGGLSTDFGAAQNMGGVKQTNEFVEKATWSLAGFIAIVSIAMTLMYTNSGQITPTPEDQNTEQTEGSQTEQPTGESTGSGEGGM
jgi:preprotein translocase subunit SecG